MHAVCTAEANETPRFALRFDGNASADPWQRWRRRRRKHDRTAGGDNIFLELWLSRVMDGLQW